MSISNYFFLNSSIAKTTKGMVMHESHSSSHGAVNKSHYLI